MTNIRTIAIFPAQLRMAWQGRIQGGGGGGGGVIGVADPLFQSVEDYIIGLFSVRTYTCMRLYTCGGHEVSKLCWAYRNVNLQEQKLLRRGGSRGGTCTPKYRIWNSEIPYTAATNRWR